MRPTFLVSLLCTIFILHHNINCVVADSLNITYPQCNNISTYDPTTPLVPCYLLPQRYVLCSVNDLFSVSKSDYDSETVGCRSYGTGERSIGLCTTLQGIDCFGPRQFNVSDYPCIRYGGYYFPTALIFSLLLGCLGIDRFYLGHCSFGLLKLLSLGGLGVWWVLDIILLVSGNLRAADQSSWENLF